MPGQWKTIRIFISSTFRDMHAERDHLVRFVFPELKERCRKRRIHLIDVDLRWGVTEEEANSGKSLDICLDEIDTCRPYFLGILGHRYGWIPPGQTHSITAQEIYHGVLHGFVPRQILDLRKLLESNWDGKELTAEQKNILVQHYKWNPDRSRYVLAAEPNPEEAEIIRQAMEHQTIYQRDRSFFFFRTEELSRKLAGAAVDQYFESSHAEQDLLEKLKQEIVQGRLPHFPYDEIEMFGQHVRDVLWQRIEAETQVLDQRDWLDEEEELQELFIADRTRRFVGRDALLKQMISFCEAPSGSPVLLLTAEPGCGKSALFSRFAQAISALHPEWLILKHFVGASASSTSLRSMLKRFCSLLYKSCNFEALKKQRLEKITGKDERAEEQRIAVEKEFSIPEDARECALRFREFLEKAAVTKKIVIVMDAVNQLETADSAHKMYWLPAQLQQGVRIVISTLPGEIQETLLARRPVPSHETMRGLEAEDVHAMVETYLREIRHKFPNPDVEKAFYQKVHHGNPLYVLVAMEELRIFGDFEKLGKRVADFPADVPALFDQVLTRVESDFNTEVVRECLSYIACGRHGMTAEELQKMLKHHAPPTDEPAPSKLPDLLWARLYRSLAAYLFERSYVIDFFHGQMKEAVERRYLSQVEARRSVHNKIADYLENRWQEPYPRALDELVYQRRKSGDWQKVQETLTNLSFLRAKTESGMIYGLAGDYDSAFDSPELPDAARSSLEDFDLLIRSNSHILASNPSLFLQQALNEPDQTQPAQLAVAKLQSILGPFFRWLNKPQSRKSACRLTLAGHADGISRCRFAPGGDVVVSSSEDGSLKLWDVRSGMEIATLAGHKGKFIRFDISPDGHRVLSSGNQENILKLWDLKTGNELGAFEGHTNGVLACLFSADSRTAASYSLDKTVRLWEVKSGHVLSVLQEEADKVLQFSPDDHLLITAARMSRDLHVWDTETKSLLETLRHENFLSAIVFSPDGKLLAVAEDHGNIHLWNLNNFKKQAILTGHSKDIYSMQFSIDGNLLASSSWDQTVKIWNVKSGSLLHSLEGHPSIVWKCSISPDSKLLVSCSEQILKLWDVVTGKEISTLRGHSGLVIDCSFSPDGKWIASASHDRTVKLWDIRLAIRPIAERDHKGLVENIVYSSSARQFASTAYSDSVVKVWDAEKGAPLEEFNLEPDRPNFCTYTPDGSELLAGGWEGALKLWSSEDGKDLLTFAGLSREATSFGFTSDGMRLIAESGNSLILWDALSGARIGSLATNNHGITSWAISPDGKRAISCSVAATPVIWDCQTGVQVAALQGLSRETDSCAFSPDGNRFLTGGRDSKLKLWDSETLQEIHEFRTPTSTPVSRCGFSPDGSRIFCSFGNGLLWLWNSTDFKFVREIRDHDGVIEGLDFSPDGNVFITVLVRKLRMYNAKTAEQIAALPVYKYGNGRNAFDFSPDARAFVMAGSDRFIHLRDAATGELRGEYWTEGAPTFLCWKENSWIAVGTNGGFVHLLKLENFSVGPGFHSEKPRRPHRPEPQLSPLPDNSVLPLASPPVWHGKRWWQFWR